MSLFRPDNHSRPTNPVRIASWSAIVIALSIASLTIGSVQLPDAHFLIPTPTDPLPLQSVTARHGYIPQDFV